MTSAPSHVVVIGGGAFGCAAAFALARAGVSATLVEPDAFGAHASGSNPGNLNPILNTPAALAPFALDSFRRHRELADELARLGVRSCAPAPVERMLLAFEDSEVERLEETADAFRGRDGFAARLLDGSAVRTFEPRLSASVRGGLLISGNMSVDSRALTGALAEGAKRLGATLLHDRVHGLDTRAGRVIGVRVGAGAIRCEAVVLATGPWVSQTREWLGLSLPVEPVKGQMLRLRLPGGPPPFDLSRGETALYRRRGDEVWVGVTREPGHLDETPTEEGRAHLLAEAARLLPGVAEAILLEHCAAVRPQTATGLPMVGQAPGWENVIVANGGGIKGMLLCAGVGKAVRDLLLAGACAMPASFQAA